MKKRGKNYSVQISHEFFIEHDDKEYLVTGCATISHDSKYGADADGNRGIPMDFIDDIQYELGDEAKTLPEEIQKKLIKTAEDQTDTGDWDAIDDYDWGMDE